MLWTKSSGELVFLDYGETCALRKGIYRPPTNVDEAVTNCNTEQKAEFFRGPNLSSPIKAIGAQQSGRIAQ